MQNQQSVITAYYTGSSSFAGMTNQYMYHVIQVKSDNEKGIYCQIYPPGNISAYYYL